MLLLLLPPGNKCEGFRRILSVCLAFVLYPSLMMSVCRAKPQIATWLPARANLLQCLFLLSLLVSWWSCSCCCCWSLNKSKEIAFNVYLPEIKIKSIPWQWQWQCHPGKQTTTATGNRNLDGLWAFVRLIDLDLVHCLAIRPIPFQMARS